METHGDEFVLELQQPVTERRDPRIRFARRPRRLGVGQFHRRCLLLNQLTQRRRLARFRLVERTPAVERALEIEQAAVQAGVRDRRREIRHQRGVAAALGQRAFGRVVGRVQIHVRRITDQTIGPAAVVETRLLAGHELERPVRAEVQNRIGRKVLTQPPIKRAEGMRRRESAFKEQSHGVAFPPERRLHADEHVPELQAHHLNRLSVGQLTTRGGAPCFLNLRQVQLAAHMIVGADRGVHIGGRAVALPIATGESFTQIVGARRQLHGIALFLERREHALHGGEHREIRRAAGIARIRREVEQDERDLALRAILPTQRHQLRHALGHAVDTLGNRLRRRRLARLRLTLTTEYGGHNGPIQFGNGDLQRGLQRIQAARIVPPLLNGLELERLQCDVRDIEPTQHRLRGLGVVVRRTTHEREAREINHGIDRRLPLAVREVLLDGRARIECGGEGRHHPQSLALQGPNDRRIVRHVVGQQIRTTDEHTHRTHVGATMPW